MRKLIGLMASVMVIGLLAMTPAVASARQVIHFDQTVAPGTTYKVSLLFGAGDVVSLAWTSDGNLKFTMTDPDGSTLRHSNGTSGSLIIEIPDGGNYTMKWQNPGSASVALGYDYKLEPEQGSSSIWIALAVILAVIAIGLVIIVAITNTNKK